jgi:hypothetical protein
VSRGRGIVNTADNEPPADVFYDPKTPVPITFPLHEALGLLLLYEQTLDSKRVVYDCRGVNYTLSAHYSIARLLEAMGRACDVGDWRLEAAGLRATLDQLAAPFL